jgi:hypothetical protein
VLKGFIRVIRVRSDSRFSRVRRNTKVSRFIRFLRLLGLLQLFGGIRVRGITRITWVLVLFEYEYEALVYERVKLIIVVTPRLASSLLLARAKRALHSDRTVTHLPIVRHMMARFLASSFLWQRAAI